MITNSLGTIKLTPKTTIQELSAEKQKEILDNFKNTDKNSDLKVGKQELTDKIIEEYQKTGKLPEGYDNIGDYIADQMEKFEKFDKNQDGKLNIDEYTSMTTTPEFNIKNLPKDYDLSKLLKNKDNDKFALLNDKNILNLTKDIFDDDLKKKIDKALAERPCGMLDILTDYDIKKGARKLELQ